MQSAIEVAGMRKIVAGYSDLELETILRHLRPEQTWRGIPHSILRDESINRAQRVADGT